MQPNSSDHKSVSKSFVMPSFGQLKTDQLRSVAAVKWPARSRNFASSLQILMNEVPELVVQAARQLQAGLDHVTQPAEPDKDDASEEADTPTLTQRVAQPLNTELKRRFGGKKAWANLTEDEDMDVSRGSKRPAELAGNFADWKTKNLESRSME